MPENILRKNREARKLTQDFVAREMNMSQNAYSKIENGSTTLTVHHLKQLSRILEMSILDLLKDEFEIHKASSMQMESITKNQLLMTIDSTRKKLNSKYPLKHDFYPVLMSLFKTIENTIEHIH